MQRKLGHENIGHDPRCGRRTPEKCSMWEWFGRPPKGFAQLTGDQKVRLARALNLGDIMTAIWVLEYILELYMVEYPHSRVRAIVHSLLSSAAGERPSRHPRVRARAERRNWSVRRKMLERKDPAYWTWKENQRKGAILWETTGGHGGGSGVKMG